MAFDISPVALHRHNRDQRHVRMLGVDRMRCIVS
jgi:hypothetical protein